MKCSLCSGDKFSHSLLDTGGGRFDIAYNAMQPMVHSMVARHNQPSHDLLLGVSFFILTKATKNRGFLRISTINTATP